MRNPVGGKVLPTLRSIQPKQVSNPQHHHPRPTRGDGAQRGSVRGPVLVSVLGKDNKTSRNPLMQEAAAGGSQIHFTPALAFDCPITTPSRMPMVTTVAK